MVFGKKAGIIEVYYLRKKREIDEGPFMQKERNLINAIAERLGKIIESKQMKDELIEAKQILFTLTTNYMLVYSAFRASVKRVRF